jgi:glycine cleavage system H protein
MDPEKLRFTQTHEWIAEDGTVGISEHAQHEITDVVFVELPKTGRVVKAAEGTAVVESVKAAFDIYSPVAGEVSAVNAALAKDPSLVNKSAYGDGWLFRVTPADPAARGKLMTHAAYQEFLKTAAH